MNNTDEFQITFQPEGKRATAKINENLLKIAQKASIGIDSTCGGRGICGKCRVIIRLGNEFLSNVSAIEEKHLSEEEIKKGYRLACLTTIIKKGKIIVEVPLESRVGYQRLLIKGIERKVLLNPAISKIDLELKKPTLDDVKADVHRIFEKLKEIGINVKRIDYRALRKSPYSLREKNWRVSVIVWKNEEIIDIEPLNELNNPCGFAIDIGTTKLAGYLLDLKTGKLLATSSAMNPQIPYGEDIISRITYAMDSEKKLQELSELVKNELNRLIKEACNEANIDPSKVYEVVAVGNTAMHHIFLKIPPKYVSLSPYPAVVQNSLEFKARDLGININEGGYVHTLPCIAGFVGADAVADILSTELHKSKQIAMTIDIGTNTEIMVGNEKRILACSAASGPAFEGAHIKYGMRASNGAIEKVWIDPYSLEVEYKTINNEKPKGLCGSGIVDAIAEMLKAGILDRKGRINTNLKSSRLKIKNGIPEFLIAWKDETNINEDISITQADVREIQLAKAAIFTGISILLKRLKISAESLERIFLAGAFGTYVNPQSARILGLYPDISLDRIKFVGNTAGSGARMALLSLDVRKEAEEIVNKIEYIELANDPEFKDEFLKAMYFPHMEIEKFPRVKKLLGG
ncbi:MAG: ASKHA domain-containing protein [Candidatus Bathyarchaeia archaeon]